MNLRIPTCSCLVVTILIGNCFLGTAQDTSNLEQTRSDLFGYTTSGAAATPVGWLDDVVSSVSNAAKVAAQNINTAKDDVAKSIKDGSLKKAMKNGWQSVSQAFNNSIQSVKQIASS